VVLLGTAYWSGLIGWLRETALEQDTIRQSDLDTLHLTDDVDEAVAMMVASRDEGQAAS
jgi:predicted Rossmann-fold nucleotide-binding protein